jgi:hydroxymethylpyrimidine/phosphomethylpyrimidine kinase
LTPTRQRAVALTVAGIDSSGGAGVVADVKTFTALGVWSAVAVTAVTVQDTGGVHGVHAIPAETVRAQLDRLRADFAIGATKTGMLVDAATVGAVAGAARSGGLGALVVDPVVRASTGKPLLDDAGLAAVIAELVPCATVVTPNVAEATALSGVPASDRAGMAAAARQLVAQGAGAALVTGGHHDDPHVAADCLVVAGSPDVVWLEAPRVAGHNDHGTGCVLSAALAAALAQGDDVVTACRRAKQFVGAALDAGVRLGAGRGAVDPGAPAISERAW